jgi:hypothetical protein
MKLKSLPSKSVPKIKGKPKIKEKFKKKLRNKFKSKLSISPKLYTMLSQNFKLKGKKSLKKELVKHYVNF